VVVVVDGHEEDVPQIVCGHVFLVENYVLFVDSAIAKLVACIDIGCWSSCCDNRDGCCCCNCCNCCNNLCSNCFSYGIDCCNCFNCCSSECYCCDFCSNKC
jgi:hypothetical protein